MATYSKDRSIFENFMSNRPPLLPVDASVATEWFAEICSHIDAALVATAVNRAIEWIDLMKYLSSSFSELCEYFRLNPDKQTEFISIAKLSGTAGLRHFVETLPVQIVEEED